MTLSSVQITFAMLRTQKRAAYQKKYGFRNGLFRNEVGNDGAAAATRAMRASDTKSCVMMVFRLMVVLQ